MVVDERDGSAHRIHMRGRFILDGVYDMLLTKFGMNLAHRVVVSGSSAGGLSVFVSIDHLAGTIHRAAAASNAPPPQIFGVPDAGYFMDMPTFKGDLWIRDYFQKVVKLHQSGQCLHICYF